MPSNCETVVKQASLGIPSIFIHTNSINPNNVYVNKARDNDNIDSEEKFKAKERVKVGIFEEMQICPTQQELGHLDA